MTANIAKKRAARVAKIKKLKPIKSKLKKKTNSAVLKRKKSVRKLEFEKNKSGIISFIKESILLSRGKKPDKILLILFIFLILGGLLMILDTSLVFAKRDFKNAYHFLILQSVSALIGFGFFLFVYLIDYKIIRKFIAVFYGITIILLIMTLFTGEINGAKSWISLGGFGIQPSELAKLTFVLYIAGNITQRRKWTSVGEFLKEDFIPFFALLGVILGLVLLGKDLGTSIILVSIALFIYFFKSRTKYEYIAFFMMLVVFTVGGIGMIVLEGYRGDRVNVYINALTKDKIVDEQGSGYQMKQILLALGSGGLTGVGLAESLQKYDLVETTAATDSVISIIAEEFGFIGATVTLLIFLAYIYRGLKITTYVKDPYGQIVAVGIVSWIGTQVFVHVASNTVVTPLTGVPMPFISYGGSSLLSCMIATGILLNISKK